MSVAELKEEAIRQFAVKVEATEDEKVLHIILDFLSHIHSDDKNSMNLSHHYDSIKAKYSSVLKKLAE
ncbi:MAG: hypothetical protein WCG87_02600 [Bacteroidota bacterium]